MSAKADEFDVVVVGAGPGGSTAATFIAMQRYRVLMIEKAKLPQYKIGESLLPSTIHGICAMLGVGDELKHANFMRKLGGTFRWGRSKDPWTFVFSASSQFSGPTSYAYQVERMKFDMILVENAKRKGVEVRELTAAVAPVVESGRVVGIEVLTAEGQRSVLRAAHIVDASGHTSVLARHAGERIYSKHFRNVAVFAYFRNGKRLPAPYSGNIFTVAFDKGWIWYIPLSAELTSVGAVIGEEYGALLRQDKLTALMQLIEECEPIRDLLAAADRVTEGPYGDVRVRKDFSYCHTSFWHPGLVLIGDAACFIDPLFSSGVHLATYSGLLAARSINSCLARAVAEEAAFNEYQRRYLREYKYFHDFLMAFYDVDQNLDAYYWAARRVLGASETVIKQESDCVLKGNSEAFIRLVGGMGGSGEPLFSIPDVEEAARLRQLGEELFPAAAGIDARGLAVQHSGGRERFMANLTAEAVQMQMQATKIPYRQPPLFEGGLVPSADGFHWTVPSRV